MKRSEFIHEIPFVSDNLHQMIHNIKNGVYASVISLFGVLDAEKGVVFVPTSKSRVSFKKDVHKEVMAFVYTNAEKLAMESNCLMVVKIGTGIRLMVVQMFRVDSDAEMPHLQRIARVRGAAGIYDHNGKKIVISKLKEEN